MSEMVNCGPYIFTFTFSFLQIKPIVLLLHELCNGHLLQQKQNYRQCGVALLSFSLFVSYY